MIQGFLTKIFGSRNERLIKAYRKTAGEINALEPAVSALTDDGLHPNAAGYDIFHANLKGPLVTAAKRVLAARAAKKP